MDNCLLGSSIRVSHLQWLYQKTLGIIFPFQYTVYKYNLENTTERGGGFYLKIDLFRHTDDTPILFHLSSKSLSPTPPSPTLKTFVTSGVETRERSRCSFSSSQIIRE